MAATGYTPISLYYSTTASAAPTAGNLVNGELAINITDGKLYYKDNTGTVKVIAGAGGAGVAGGSNTQVQFNSSGSLAGSSNFTWNGTTLAITGAVTATADSAFTSTGALQLPSGTTGQQPTGVAGKIRFNTTTGTFEGYNGTTWGAIGGAPTGAYTRTDVTATGGQTTFTGLTYQVGYIQVYLNGVLLDPSDYTATSGTSVVLGTAAVAGDIVSFVVLTISSIGNAANISGGAANQIPYQSGVSTTTFSSGLTFDGTNFATTGTASATKLIPTGGSATGNGMYLPASNTLAWSNNGSETMRLDSSGNLGLGVTPSAWSVGKAFEARNAGNAIFTNGVGEMILTANAYYNAGWKYGNTGVQAARYVCGNTNGTHIWETAASGTAGNAITFTQAMTLDASGNLGIGTSSPAYNLDVSKATNGTTVVRVVNTNSGANASAQMYVENGTNSLQLGMGGTGFTTYGTLKANTGWVYSGSSAGITLAADNASGIITFGLGSGVAEKARFSTSGGFSVGTTADPGAGAIYATGNITAYYSDDRLKTKLGGIENALDKVKSLSGFYYEANQTAQDLGYKVKREVGVSAQQVQAVLPEVVSPAPIDQQYLTVDYERIVPLLIEAIKELEEKVAKLEAK